MTSSGSGMHQGQWHPSQGNQAQGHQGFGGGPQAPHGWPQHGMHHQVRLQAPPPPNRSKGGLIAVGVLVVMLLGAGALGALASYNADTKAVVAKNDVVAISRAATAAYARTGRVCGTATPVPAAVPRKGRAVKPSAAPGQDFQSGSPTEGWTCLGFSRQEGLRYQLEVRVGGSYKGTARGMADPGPGAVEVSAEGDLDGDGRTGLIVLVGRVDPSTRQLVFPRELTLFNHKE